MTTSYTFVTSSVANTVPISSTKVKVVANNSCYFAINTLAGPTANAGPMIAQLRSTDVNMQGVGNFLSIVPAGQTITAITVTPIGTVSSASIPDTTNMRTA